MRRFLFVIYTLISFSLFAVDTDKMLVSIPVDFSVDRGVVLGFSTSRVSNIYELPNELEEIKFEYDTDEDVLTSGTFYLNVQVFTSRPISVRIINPKGFSESANEEVSIDYENIGSSSSTFKASGGGSVNVLEEPGNMTYMKPRYYPIEFHFVVYPEQLTSNITSSMELKTELKVEVVTQ